MTGMDSTATRIWKGEEVHLSYCVVSEGPAMTRGVHHHPVLIVRGLGMTLADSRTWAQAVAKRTQRAVVIMDNRGSGNSSMPQSLYTFNDMADDSAAVMRDFARTHGTTPRFHLVGVSMGGLIAMKCALRHPDLLVSLTIGCSYILPLPEVGIPERYHELVIKEIPSDEAERTAHFVEMFRFSFTPKWCEENVVRWDELKASFVASEIARLGNPGGSGQESAIKDYMDVGMYDEAVRITVPTLVITGDQDILIPMQNTLNMRKSIPNATLAVIPSAGHLFWEMEPDATYTIFERFFGRHDTAPAKL